MKTIKGNIWEIDADTICVTTNRIVKNNGEAVMGAGIALQCKQRYPQSPSLLGYYLNKFGNIPFPIAIHRYNNKIISVYSFPTKNHYKDKSDLKLIQKSLLVFRDDFEFQHMKKIVIPYPGCQNGGLNWETQVKPLMEELVGKDDRFYFISQ